MIYFDNAATSFPKPKIVAKEVAACIGQWCGNPGRGAHELSRKAAEKIYATRESLSSFFGVKAPERIVFLQNTTMALNIALKGMLCPGDHVLCSELEHNAVIRPLEALKKTKGVTFDTFPVLGRTPEEIISSISERKKENTAAIVCLHASNICSVTLPLEKIGSFCQKNNLRFIVDAAQSAGHLPIDMQKMHIDALAAPAHKGLLGIPGCGILALGEHVKLQTVIEGGSGLDSLSRSMPNDLPERLEAGTLPVCAIAGLSGGLSFLKDFGTHELETRTKSLFFAARERLETLGGYKIYQKETPGSVLLFNREGVPSTALARILDHEGICVRAGLHCAPMAHKALATSEGGGVRLGFGIFNTVKELDTLFAALRKNFS